MSNNSDQIIVKHKDSMIENLRRFLFGDDIFISYSHVDSTYALSLANELTKKKLSCFLDQWGTPPGQELPKELINTLKRCSTMVLVGSKYAAESKNVGIEVEKFLETHRSIIPITFVEDDLMGDTTEDADPQNLTGTLEQAKWYFTISGIAKTIEKFKALKTGTPSENIISRIVNATEFRSRSKRLHRAFFATLGTIGLIILLGAIVVYDANNRVKAAQKYADEAIKEANEKTLLAKEETAKADRATLRADFQETRASEQEKRANEKAEEANKATKETQKQIAIASEQTRIAGAAKKREGEAKLSEKTAIRENFIERARQDLNNNYPFRAAVYLNEAYGMFPTNEEPRRMSSFRFLLGLSMKSVESLLFKTPYQEDVLSIRFSPDGKYIVTADGDYTKNTENTARILNAKTGKDVSPTITIQHGFDVNTAEFSLDSKRIVTSSDDNTARFWDLEAKKGFIFKHPANVKSAIFSPDGKRIATIDSHGTAKVWTIGSYKEDPWPIVSDKEDFSLKTKEIISSKGDEKFVKLAAFSPDLKQILIVDYDGRVTLYDIEKKQQSAPFGFKEDDVSQSPHEGDGQVTPAQINTAVFSPNGKYIVTASDDDTAKVLDLDTKKVVHFQHQSRVLSAEFSRDSKRIVTVSANNTVSVWDIKTEAFVTSVQHENMINSAKFSPDGSMIVTASNDKTAKVWDAKTGILLASLEHESFVFLAEFSPDSRQIVTASRGHIKLYEHEKVDRDSHDHMVKLWNLSARADISTVAHQKNVVSARFSTNNDQIVTASWDGTAIIQDVNTGKGILINPEKCPESSGDLPPKCLVRSAEFSHDEKQVVIGAGNRATVWDAKTGNLIHSLRHSGLVSSAEFSPDDKYVVTASYDGTVKVWDLLNTKEPIATIEHHGNVNSAKFSPDGKRIATAGDDHTAKVYDLEKRRVIATVQHEDVVFSANFSPDSSQIVSASRDKTAQIFDISANEAIAIARHTELILSAEFSPDGKTIVTAGYDNTANIWDKTGTLIVSMQHQNRVRSAKFSPDGSMIVTASDDKTAKVWDVETGKLLVSVKHQELVRSAEFSPDGTQIVTASFDDTAKVWRFSPETRSLEVIEEIVRSKVPFRLENGALVPREIF